MYGGLGFDVDWGALVGNTVKAFGAIQQGRASLTLQRAQQAAALRAQQTEFQIMQQRQFPTGAHPAGEFVRLAPALPRQSELPPWVIPAAVGLAVVFLMRK